MTGRLAVLALLGVLVAGCTAPAQPLSSGPANAPQPTAEEAPSPPAANSPETQTSASAPPPSCPDPFAPIAKQFDAERVNVSANDLAAPPTTPPLGVPMTLWSWCAAELPATFTAHFVLDIPEETRCEFSGYGASKTAGVFVGMMGMHGDAIEHFGFGSAGIVLGAHAVVADTDMVTDALYAGGAASASFGEGVRPWGAGEHAITFAFSHAEAWDNGLSGNQAGGWYLACEDPFVLTGVEGSAEALLFDVDYATGGVGAHAAFTGADVADEVRGTFASPSVMVWGLGFDAVGKVDVVHQGGSASWTFQPPGFQTQTEVAAPGEVAIRMTGIHPLFGEIWLLAAGHGPVDSLEALGAIHS